MLIKPRLGSDLLVAVRKAMIGHTFVSPDLVLQPRQVQ